MVPYRRHPLKVGCGHLNHGLDMKHGWGPDIQSLEDFDENECNIVFEPWVWNTMRGQYDHYYDAMVNELQNTLPLGNPPYWPQDLPTLQDVPDLWDLALQKQTKKKKKKKKSSKPKPSKPKSSKSKTKKPTPKTSSSAEPKDLPPYQNLANNGNTCYVSSALQCIFRIPELRAVLSSDMPFSEYQIDQNGRTTYRKNVAAQRKVVEELRKLADIVDNAKVRVPRTHVGDVLRAVRVVDPQFEEGRENDAALFFDTICSILNAAGDKSASAATERFNRGQAPTKLPLELVTEEHDMVSRGTMINPIHDDTGRSMRAHRAIGNDSPLTDAIGYQIANESFCSVNACPSPFTRSWTHGECFVIDFGTRPAREPGQQPPPLQTRRLIDLIEGSLFVDSADAGNAEAGTPCLAAETHPRKTTTHRKPTRLPPLLCLRINRLVAGLDRNQSPKELENQPSMFILDPLQYEEELDLREAVDRLLPSEDALGPLPTAEIRTRYRLSAIIQYRNAHYVAYIKVQDSEGQLRWAIFNDLQEKVRWENPFFQETRGTVGEFMLLYHQVSPEEEAAEAAEAAEVTRPGDESGDVEMPDASAVTAGDDESEEDTDDEKSDESDEDDLFVGESKEDDDFADDGVDDEDDNPYGTSDDEDASVISISDDRDSEDGDEDSSASGKAADGGKVVLDIPALRMSNAIMEVINNTVWALEKDIQVDLTALRDVPVLELALLALDAEDARTKAEAALSRFKTSTTPAQADTTSEQQQHQLQGLQAGIKELETQQMETRTALEDEQAQLEQLLQRTTDVQEEVERAEEALHTARTAHEHLRAEQESLTQAGQHPQQPLSEDERITQIHGLLGHLQLESVFQIQQDIAAEIPRLVRAHYQGGTLKREHDAEVREQREQDLQGREAAVQEAEAARQERYAAIEAREAELRAQTEEMHTAEEELRQQQEAFRVQQEHQPVAPADSATQGGERGGRGGGPRGRGRGTERGRGSERGRGVASGSARGRGATSNPPPAASRITRGGAARDGEESGDGGSAADEGTGTRRPPPPPFRSGPYPGATPRRKR